MHLGTIVDTRKALAELARDVASKRGLLGRGEDEGT
jgi:hypothetical protein